MAPVKEFGIGTDIDWIMALEIPNGTHPMNDSVSGM